jgi:pyruvate ferredoxin oxidoreductase gamma subunit
MTTKETKLPVVNESGFYEIRMESIGGLGANLAGKILGEAGVLNMGFNGSNFSSYGSEKKGSPVKAFVRFCSPDAEVRVNSPVTEPHILAIFHENLTKSVPVTQGVGPSSIVILNTSKKNDEARDFLKLHAGALYCIDALKIAIEEKTRINTAILGTICRASGFLSPDAIKDMIAKNLGKKYASLIEPNLKTFDRGYNEAVSKKFASDGKYPYIPFTREGQKIGYFNQPIGGVIPVAGSSVSKDLSGSREGWIPVLNRSKCTSCGECDITCPDYCFVWENGVDKKGKPARILKSIIYQYCKGCLRCVDICKFEALTKHKEFEVDKAIMEKGYTE